MAGFNLKYSLSGHNTGIVISVVLTNSDTHTVGDMIHFEQGTVDNGIGTADPAVAGERLGGVIVGIVDKNGLPLDNPNAVFSGAWTQLTETYVASGTNDATAGDQVRALVNIDQDAVYANATDGVFGTTADADKLGSYTDLANEAEVDETNAGNAVTVVAQLVCLGVDPENAAQGLYKIVEAQLVA